MSRSTDQAHGKMGTTRTLPLTLVVITKNEAEAIERCLKSCAQVASEAIVVDSGSTDETVAIATAMGARVIEHEWLGYSRQRNLGVQAAAHDWVLCLDADEFLSDRLRASIRDIFSEGLPAPSACFSVERTIDFLGRELPNPLRRSNTLNFVRLYNRRTASWDESQSIHERVKYEGRPTLLVGRLIHWQGMTYGEEIDALNRYSSAEAEVMKMAGVGTIPAWKFAVLPVARFLWVYVGRGHFRYGGRGLLHALLRGAWELARLVKVWEIEHLPTIRSPGPDLR